MDKNEKTLQYSSRFGRDESWLKLIIWQFFLIFQSPGRMLIEVFIRRDFGERYFRLSTAIGIFLFLVLWPLKPLVEREIMGFYLSGPYGRDLPDLYSQQDHTWHFLSYGLWYVYAGLFLWVCIGHHKAMKRAPSVFDFARYSMSSGYINKKFADMAKNFGREGDIRFIEIWLEPLPFFLIGFMLSGMGQQLGPLLMASAVVYSFSYRMAYRWGDNYVMDIIDNMIVNRDLTASFVDDVDPSETGGYRFLGRKPSDPRKRRAVLDNRMPDEDVPTVK